MNYKFIYKKVVDWLQFRLNWIQYQNIQFAIDRWKEIAWLACRRAVNEKYRDVSLAGRGSVRLGMLQQ